MGPPITSFGRLSNLDRLCTVQTQCCIDTNCTNSTIPWCHPRSGTPPCSPHPLALPCLLLPAPSTSQFPAHLPVLPQPHLSIRLSPPGLTTVVLFILVSLPLA